MSSGLYKSVAADGVGNCSGFPTDMVLFLGAAWQKRTICFMALLHMFWSQNSGILA